MGTGHIALAVTGALLVACGPGATPSGGRSTTGLTVADNTNAPPPERYVPPPTSAPPSAPTSSATSPSPVGRAGSGTSRDDPVAACGPTDSYTYVAQQFQCPNGTNPFGGDADAARDARVGNVGANASGHIIDLYRVPCPGGAVDVFVDMYGCPEMENTLGGG